MSDTEELESLNFSRAFGAHKKLRFPIFAPNFPNWCSYWQRDPAVRSKTLWFSVVASRAALLQGAPAQPQRVSLTGARCGRDFSPR
eukprot:3433599-Prymnesium_polylepis.1